MFSRGFSVIWESEEEFKNPGFHCEAVGLYNQNTCSRIASAEEKNLT